MYALKTLLHIGITEVRNCCNNKMYCLENIANFFWETMLLLDICNSNITLHLSRKTKNTSNITFVYLNQCFEVCQISL